MIVVPHLLLCTAGLFVIFYVLYVTEPGHARCRAIAIVELRLLVFLAAEQRLVNCRDFTLTALTFAVAFISLTNIVQNVHCLYC